MAIHLTPTELAREAGLERREVIAKCMELGVPIFQGRIDKTLFLASSQASITEAFRPSRVPRGRPGVRPARGGKPRRSERARGRTPRDTLIPLVSSACPAAPAVRPRASADRHRLAVSLAPQEERI